MGNSNQSGPHFTPLLLGCAAPKLSAADGECMSQCGVVGAPQRPQSVIAVGLAGQLLGHPQSSGAGFAGMEFASHHFLRRRMHKAFVVFLTSPG